MAKRKAVGVLIAETGPSERRACRIVGLGRSVRQYRPVPKDDMAVIKRIKELASENRRHGYLRPHALVRREGLVADPNRTCRLHAEQGLQVRTGKRCKLPRRDRVCPHVPERPMQRWSMDFVGDQLADCRRFCVPNIVDDHGRVCPGQIADVPIPGARSARFPDDLALRFGLPGKIVLALRMVAPPVRAIIGDGPEGTGKAMSDRSERTGVRLRFIAPGKPAQHAFALTLGKVSRLCEPRPCAATGGFTHRSSRRRRTSNSRKRL